MASFLDTIRPFLPARFRERRPVVPVVRLVGAIGAVSPLRPGLSIASCAAALERAFAVKGAKAVAIVVNSPGGSPVQSHLIYRRIRSLSLEKKLSVLVFVEDAAASGGYMIACAGDEIIADPSSIVGSVGVVSAGFGLDRLIERYGVDRRVHTTGPRKAMLDPFRPENPDDIVRLKAIQSDIFTAFSDLVAERRGTKLTKTREELFTGDIWAGRAALDLGLVDAIGDLRTVLRARFGAKVRMPVMPLARPGFLARLLGRDPTIGSLIDPGQAIAAVEERSLWARLGL
ncbi:S49 family peptidase [Salinarimonas soli]|uniref:S49 family peptidase n=1 Tax=Salinarimonas soli TaxID=1638099 RepID=A0A5B2V7G7_9HYPH|nr:S49 family peptidase [Salinarimonas soli]KAA2234372.1 S49 family peptidase [Salinarimonas soli]